MRLGAIVIVCAIIGLASGGFWGLVIGAIVGAYLQSTQTTDDEESNPPFQSRVQETYQETSFNRSLLVLIAAVMTADGKTMKSELDLVKAMLVRTYGEVRASRMLLDLRELLKSSNDIAGVCSTMRQGMAYSQRLELLHVLFRISRADGEVTPPEIQLLQFIAAQLGITTPDFLSIRAMFVTTPGGEFQILEVSKDASEEEVKKAYRKMAMRFHPDRLTGLGEEEKKSAEEKFRKVQEAYEKIKKQKGWS